MLYSKSILQYAIQLERLHAMVRVFSGVCSAFFVCFVLRGMIL